VDVTELGHEIVKWIHRVQVRHQRLAAVDIGPTKRSHFLGY
jgi:hypothetical protein